MTYDNLLFRCSSAGNLIAEKEVAGGLTETAIGLLEEKHIFAQYGIEKDIESKYMTKGTQVEDDSITLLSRLDKIFYKKNTQIFSDDFIIGTPDIVTQDCIIDIKSNWDIFSFYKAKRAKKMNKLYYWQLMCYMHLTGLKSAKLVYCLVDTPEQFIEKEIINLWYKLGKPSSEDKYFIQASEDLRKKAIYNHIPMKERVSISTLEYDAKEMERLQKIILIARKYMNDNFLNN